jgi:hypothetical protein
MPYFPIDPPPGVVRTGAEYKVRGRYYDANLIRWVNGALQPIGGWLQHSLTPVTGRPRAMHSWRDNTGVPWLAVGTESNLFAMTRDGAMFDITPSGFTAGRPDATTGAGYGAGDYGDGLYGTPRDSAYSILPASVWSLDNYGQDLVGVMADDGYIYLWELDTGTPADVLTDAPTASSLVVTAEHIIMAFGAGGDPRLIKWCDIDDPTDWAEAVDNYARQQTLHTDGQIMGGININGGTLVFTDNEVWIAQFIGQPSVYGFHQRGSGCGLVSLNGVVAAQSSAFWMSNNGFWRYDGYAQPLQCDVQDYVFSDFNNVQASKVFAIHVSQFKEIWWFYPSGSSDEIDRYVVYNYVEGWWSIGSRARLAGLDKGAFPYPMMTGANGHVYDHEYGTERAGIKAYATAGPFEFGEGDKVVHLRKIVPAGQTLGSVQVSFRTRFYPEGDETVSGWYSLTENTDVRITCRQLEVTFRASDSTNDFRVGRFRLEGTLGGLR